MRRWIVGGAAVTLTAIALLLAVRDRADRSAQQVIQREVRDLVTCSNPEGGPVLHFSGLERSATGVTAYWQVETAMSWERYQYSLETRCFSGFERRVTTGSSLAATKALSGDVYTVDVERIEGSSPMRVQWTFRGMPF